MKEKNYDNTQSGLKKIRELLELPKTVIMATHLEKIPFSISPIMLLKIDEQGDLWFFSNKNSQHFKDIENDNKVQLVYFDEGKQTYISIFGNAVQVVDEQKTNELWNPRLQNWFDGGTDPNLVLFNINMENALYWESTGHKLVDLINMDPTENQKNGNIDLQTN